MLRDRVPVPDEFRQLLELIERGKSFAFEGWIKAGKPLRVPDVPDALPKLPDQAIHIKKAGEPACRRGGVSSSLSSARSSGRNYAKLSSVIFEEIKVCGLSCPCQILTGDAHESAGEMRLAGCQTFV
jgi:hypothetical protein